MEKNVHTTIVDTTLKIALLVLDRENEVPEHFEIMTILEAKENGTVNVSGCYSTDFNWMPNKIDGYIESYDRIVKWADFAFTILDTTNVKLVFDVIMTELYDMIDEFGENTKNK